VNREWSLAGLCQWADSNGSTSLVTPKLLGQKTAL
jgi:hypothetical protein